MKSLVSLTFSIDLSTHFTNMSVDQTETARYFVYIACADLECMASLWHEYSPIESQTMHAARCLPFSVANCFYEYVHRATCIISAAEYYYAYNKNFKSYYNGTT